MRRLAPHEAGDLRAHERAGLLGRLGLLGEERFATSSRRHVAHDPHVVAARHALIGADDDAATSRLLKPEGVVFDDHDRVDLEKYGWPESDADPDQMTLL